MSANRPLAEEIAESIGVPLSSCDIMHFADGEINVQINETVRGHHVFIIQPTSKPVNDHLMEVLVMCDALKRASAKTINLVIPYYGYSRQDRKSRSRQPITAKASCRFATNCRCTSCDLYGHSCSTDSGLLQYTCR